MAKQYPSAARLREKIALANAMAKERAINKADVVRTMPIQPGSSAPDQRAMQRAAAAERATTKTAVDRIPRQDVTRAGSPERFARANTLGQAQAVFNTASRGTPVRNGRVNPLLETIMRPVGSGQVDVTGPVRRGSNVFRKTRRVRGSVNG